LGGWSDVRMVQRYVHLAPEHFRHIAWDVWYGGTFLGTPHISGIKMAYQI